jgi:hypothetical protein
MITFDEGVYVYAEDGSVKVLGTVRGAVVAAACPPGTQRVPGPCGSSWEATAGLAHECAADFPGEIGDLLAGMLGEVLRRFALVSGVRAVVWEEEARGKVLLRFKVRGEMREKP